MANRLYRIGRAVTLFLCIGILLHTDVTSALNSDPCAGAKVPTDGSLSCAQKRAFTLGAYQLNTDACQSSPAAAVGTPVAIPSDLPLESKITQSFIVGINADGTTTDQVTALVTKYPYLGGIFFTGHPAQHGFDSTFIKSLNTIAKVPLLVASDEEGGSVQRFADNPAVGGINAAGVMGKQTVETVKATGAKVGVGLSSLGVTVDLAPVLDTYKNISNSDNIISSDTGPDNSRSFGTSGGADLDTANIIAKAGAFAEGLAASGVSPIYKHFPGLGQVAGNSDNGPLTLASSTELSTEIAPYKALASKNSGGVMLSNAFVPDWNGGAVPTSISSDAVSYLRSKVGFSGMITTDDLIAIGKSSYGAKAVALPDAITGALRAGVTMPLFSYTDDATIDGAVQKVMADSTASNNVDTALTTIATFKGNATTNTASPSTGCCSTATTTLVALKGEDNPRIAYNFLIDEARGPAKLTAIAAAGAVGNLMQESYGVDPDAVNDIGATGIAQWLYGRKTSLEEYAKANGSPTDGVGKLQVQLGFLNKEMTSSKAGIVSEINAATTVDQAATIWEEKFEVAGGSALDKRILNAQALYALATGKATSWPENIPVATNGVTGGDSGAAGANNAITAASGGSNCSSGSISVNGDAKELAQQILDSDKFEFNDVAKEDLVNTASGKGSLSGCGDIVSLDKDLLATLLKTSAKYKMYLGNFITGRSCSMAHPKGWAVDIMSATDIASNKKTSFCTAVEFSQDCPNATLDGEFANFLASNMPQDSIINQTGCAGRTTVQAPPGVEMWPHDTCNHEHINMHQPEVH